MADKKDSKEAKPQSNTLESLIAFIFGLFIIATIFNRLIAAFGSEQAFFDFFSFEGVRRYFSREVLPILSVVSYAFSAFFAFGIGWTISNLSKINKEMNALYNPPIPVRGEGELSFEAEGNPKWERVLSHLNSDNQNDWKFAILEADIMLSDMLDTLQYRGATVAEKLKAVEESDFQTIEAAWEAHKIRNVIAHEGADFAITDREARRVIDLYRSVFEEFHII
jgi:hypothetical protein